MFNSLLAELTEFISILTPQIKHTHHWKHIGLFTTFGGLFRISPIRSFHAESEIVSNIVPHVILKIILKLLF